MDEQRLPPLKNFEADVAPPETPDPWWKRYCVYVFFVMMTPCVFAGCVYCLEIIYVSKMVKYSNIDAYQFGQMLKDHLTIAMVASLICGIGLSVYNEVKTIIGNK